MFSFNLVLIATRSPSPARYCSRCELEIGGGGSGKRARLPFCTHRYLPSPVVSPCPPVTLSGPAGPRAALLATRARTAAARGGPGPGPSACPRRVRAGRWRAWLPCPRAAGCPARCGRLGCRCGEGPPGAGSRPGPARCGRFPAGRGGRQAGPRRRSGPAGLPGQRALAGGAGASGAVVSRAWGQNSALP